jgi:hypothetical protein
VAPGSGYSPAALAAVPGYALAVWRMDRIGLPGELGTTERGLLEQFAWLEHKTVNQEVTVAPCRHSRPRGARDAIASLTNHPEC